MGFVVALPFADNIFAVSSILVVLALLMYYITRFGEIRGNIGYAYTVFPWVNTFPETLVSTITAVLGYPVVSIWNSVFSATFDAAAVYGVAGLRSERPIVFRVSSLVYPTVIGGLLFAALLGSDGKLSMFDGAVLYIYLAVATAIALSLYGFRVRAAKRDLVRHVLSLLIIGAIAFIFSGYAMALADLISQKVAGIVAAALTSLPDLITAVVYGLESDVSQSETLGCIMHDFAENMATAALVAGLFGKEIADANPVLTSMVVALTMVALVAALSDGDIDRYDGILLIGTFIVLAAASMWL
jgi:cation:H+ antiporter